MNYQKVYMNQIFSSSLMGQVAELWRNQILCDAVIKTGNVDTKAHRLVIVAACPMLQHMENAALGAHLEVRLAADIKQEAVVTFLQYLYEGFMLLTEENCKDVEKIAKLLQVESVVKCCSDFNKCLSEKTGMPCSANTRFTLKEQGDSVYVRTTSLLKVQEAAKRSFDDHSPTGPVNKRQKANLSTPPPPLLLPMLNITQQNNERINVSKDFTTTSRDSPERAPRIATGLPLLSKASNNFSEVMEDSLEVLHREPPNPDDIGKSVEQPVQQTMSISVASQIANNTDVQVVSVTSPIPIAHSSATSSSRRGHRSSLSDRTNVPMTVLKSSFQSVQTDTPAKQADWNSSVNTDGGRGQANISHLVGQVQHTDSFHVSRSSYYPNTVAQEIGTSVLATQRPASSPSGQGPHDVLPPRLAFPVPHSKLANNLQQPSSFTLSGVSPRMVTLTNPFSSGPVDRAGIIPMSSRSSRDSSPSYRNTDVTDSNVRQASTPKNGQSTSTEVASEPPDLSIVKQEDIVEDSGGDDLHRDNAEDSKMSHDGFEGAEDRGGDDSSNTGSDNGSWQEITSRGHMQQSETLQDTRSTYNTPITAPEAIVPGLSSQRHGPSPTDQGPQNAVPQKLSFTQPHSKQQASGNVQHSGMFATSGINPRLMTLSVPFALGSAAQGSDRQSLIPPGSPSVRVSSPSSFAARQPGGPGLSRNSDGADKLSSQASASKGAGQSSSSDTTKDQSNRGDLKEEYANTGGMELQIDLGEDSKTSFKSDGTDDQFADDCINAVGESATLWQESTFRETPRREKYHLWKFARDLLHDPKFCPRIIKWENVEDGVFRIVNTHEVARMWGAIKKFSKMNYEHMSRSFRYSKTLGYFADVPKDGGYPKKLCFRFGPKAHGWKPKLPLISPLPEFSLLSPEFPLTSPKFTTEQERTTPDHDPNEPLNLVTVKQENSTKKGKKERIPDT